MKTINLKNRKNQYIIKKKHFSLFGNPDLKKIPKRVLDIPGVQQIAEKYGAASAMLIHFLVNEQKKENQENFLVPFRNKVPTFKNESAYFESSDVLDSEIKVFNHLSKNPNHYVAVKLQRTNFCVVDIDTTENHLIDVVIKYRKKVDSFFLRETTKNGYHLWALKPKGVNLGSKTKATNSAGFRFDFLSTGFCIISVGKDRHIDFFTLDNFKELDPIYWPTRERIDYWKLNYIKGERFKELCNIAEFAYDSGVPLNIDRLNIINEIICNPPKLYAEVGHAFNKSFRGRIPNQLAIRDKFKDHVNLKTIQTDKQDQVDIEDFFDSWGWEVGEIQDYGLERVAGLSRDIEERFESYLKYFENRWYAYSEVDRKWSVIEDHKLNSFLLKYIRYFDQSIYSKRVRDDILSEIKDRVLVVGDDASKCSNYMQFNDKVFDLETLRSYEPSKKFFCPYYKEFDLDLNAKPTMLFNMWEETFEIYEEVRDFLRIVCSLAARKRAFQYDIYVEFVGRAGSGKSLLIHLITALVGIENTADITFTGLEKKDFALQDVYDKSLIVVNECPGDIYDMPANFKKITSGDMINVQRKYQNAFQTHIRGLIILVGNSDITFQCIRNDRSQLDSINRRKMTIPFKSVPERPDPKLFYVGSDNKYHGKLLSEIPKLWGWALSMFPDEIEEKLKSDNRAYYFPMISPQGKYDVNYYREKLINGEKLNRNQTEFLLMDYVDKFLRKNIEKGGNDAYILTGFHAKKKDQNDNLLGFFLNDQKENLELLGYDPKKNRRRQKLNIKTIKKRLEMGMYTLFHSKMTNPDRKGYRFSNVKIKIFKKEFRS